MAAHDEIHAHDRVADIEQRGIYGAIGRRARERLHIYKQIISAKAVAGEELRRSPSRQRLENVGVLGAFVIALVGITTEFWQAVRIIEDCGLRHAPRVFQRVTLGVDVVKGRAEGIAYSEGHSALRWDHDQLGCWRVVSWRINSATSGSSSSMPPRKRKSFVGHGMVRSLRFHCGSQFYHGHAVDSMLLGCDESEHLEQNSQC